MPKPNFMLLKDAQYASPVARSSEGSANRRSPLSELVGAHLQANNMRQVDFCRETGFDQGLLSKILSSVVSTLNVETALKLAEGLNVSPAIVFEAIGKKDVDEMLRRFYCSAQQTNRLM
jgi:transcriptional regulator with XRE-family HTH domain